MSVEHLATVLHHSKAKGTAKLILLGIANHQGDGGAWPSMATLATYGGCNLRNARAAVARLVEMRELRVDVQGGGTAHTADHARPNRYDVLVICPPWCDRTPNHRDTRQRPQPALVPVDKPPVASDRPTPDPRSEATPHPRSPATPEPSLEPCANEAPAQTTDRARAVRPGCMPGCVIDQDNHDGVCRLSSEPPSEALAEVREQLAAASSHHRDRERGIERDH